MNEEISIKKMVICGTLLGCEIGLLIGFLPSIQLPTYNLYDAGFMGLLIVIWMSSIAWWSAGDD